MTNNDKAKERYPLSPLFENILLEISEGVEKTLAEERARQGGVSDLSILSDSIDTSTELNPEGDVRG